MHLDYLILLLLFLVIDELPEIEKKAVELFNKDPEKAIKYLTAYSNNFDRAMIHAYWELGDKLWAKYTRRF